MPEEDAQISRAAIGQSINTRVVETKVKLCSLKRICFHPSHPAGTLSIMHLSKLFTHDD